MLKHYNKFENLEVELFDLQSVLKNSLQNDVLDIKSINHTCEKFIDTSIKFPKLTAAKYVIYSKYMTEKFHDSESFIFVDNTGATVCTLSGRDLDLYDMIQKCENLIESQNYK